MSLRTRLRISIVTLVTSLVLMQCVVSLHVAAEAHFKEAFERASSIADQVRLVVTQRVNEQSTAEQDPGALPQIVENDTALPSLLEKTMASSTAIVEIVVCDTSGRVLASSSPVPSRVNYQSLPNFSDWMERQLWDRLLEVLTQSKDYAIVIPLGVNGVPVLTIRTIVSSVLIRNAIWPQVQSLALVSVLSLLASILLAFLFSNVVFRSLDRLSRRIESIAAGGPFPPPDQKASREAKEIADMQSKLDALGQQFRGAKDDVQALRSNVERMLERLEEAVLLFDPEFRLLRASRPAERLLAATREELAGRRLQELFPDTAPLGLLIRDSVDHHQPVRDVTVALERAGADPLRLLVNTEWLDGFPLPGQSSLLLTLRDAETRRQIRSQLDISTRLAAISRLTGGVAHEIKNPLNAMALHLEILKSKLSSHDEVRGEMAVIGGEIARLDRVVKTFLDFTRPVEVKMREINMVELARQVAALVWPQAERSHVSVELEAPRPVTMIRGDEDLLKQALLNVVNNGIEAMKTGGRLQIRVERSGDEIITSVRDEGGGIPAELKEKIFNLYFSTKQKGSGIGLAMTFRIIQLHNATIDFTSETGRGTTFYLRFPSPEEETPAAEEAEPQRLAR